MKNYWWSHPCEEGIFNFGDLISPLLLNAYGLVDYVETASSVDDADVLFAGSLLQSMSQGKTCTIVGSGMLTDQRLHFPHAKILALRGQLTKDRLSVQEDIPLGDPGLLISRILPIDTSKEYDKPIGIVPHWKHYASPRLDSYRSDPRYKIINPRCELQCVVHEICSCSVIIASSLHALIVADAYGIPNVRMDFDDESIDVRDFKYLDYYSAIGRTEEAAKIKPENLSQVDPSSINSSYQKNIAKVQDALHEVMLSFAREVRKNYGELYQEPNVDISTAMRMADCGDVRRMNYIGDLYYQGEVVLKCPEKAFRWYQSAANRGYHWGMFNLGKCYYEGVGVEKNDAEARRWYERAADFGNFWAVVKLAEDLDDAPSMEYLSKCYAEAGVPEYGIPPSVDKVFFWRDKMHAARKQKDESQEDDFFGAF